MSVELPINPDPLPAGRPFVDPEQFEELVNEKSTIGDIVNFIDQRTERRGSFSRLRVANLFDATGKQMQLSRYNHNSSDAGLLRVASISIDEISEPSEEEFQVSLEAPSILDDVQELIVFRQGDTFALDKLSYDRNMECTVYSECTEEEVSEIFDKLNEVAKTRKEKIRKALFSSGARHYLN